MPFLSDLRSLVGAEYVAETQGQLVVAPASTEEVSAVLRICSEYQVTLTPSGGGTKFAWGNPIQTDVALKTGRIAGIREHVWQDLTATVGAGTVWGQMEAALAQHGQHVALDAAMPGKATVGGVLAVNDSGALRIKYGSLRDLVIGMTIVLADGTVARSGGKVVKNVAGYDLPKLFIGSYGTLGVITEVNFRLHPVEAHTQSWTVSGSGLELGKLIQQLRESATSLQSLQLRSDGETIALDVRFASAPAALEQDAKRLKALCLALHIESANDDVWNWRDRLFTDANAVALKITCLPSQIERIVSGFAKSAVIARCAAEAAGIITAQLNGDPELITSLIEDLRARLAGSGGMVAVLQWPFTTHAIERWGGSPPAIAVMRELKQQFDGKQLLNPGKFVGGI